MTDEERSALRNVTTDAVTELIKPLAPDEDLAMWPTEWVLCVAWVDEDGDTWITRLKSHEKMPDYRVDGLLRFSTTAEMNVALAMQPPEDD